MAKDTRDLQRHVTNDLLARRLQKVAHRRFVLGLPTVRRKTLLSFVQQHLLLDLVEHIRCRDVGPDGGIAHHDCLSSTTHPHFHDNRGITLKTSRWPGASAYLKALVASEHTSLPDHAPKARSQVKCIGDCCTKDKDHKLDTYGSLLVRPQSSHACIHQHGSCIATLAYALSRRASEAAQVAKYQRHSVGDNAIAIARMTTEIVHTVYEKAQGR
jgi:hypothetical protein